MQSNQRLSVVTNAAFSQEALAAPTQRIKPITNLKGHFLLAHPEIEDGLEGTVVYVCSHDKNGALGMVVNQPSFEVQFRDVAESMGIETLLPATELPIVYDGGPLETQRGFVLHSPEYRSENSRDIQQDVALSGDKAVVQDMARGQGPEQAHLCLGHVGWNAGQLEEEIKEDCWFVVPATPDVLFNLAPEAMYDELAKLLHLEASSHKIYSATVGVA